MTKIDARRLILWAVLIAVLAATTALTIGIMRSGSTRIGSVVATEGISSENDQPLEAIPGSTHPIGCMIYADRQAGQSGKVYGVKVHVTYLPCAQVAGDAGAEKKDVYVGGPVKLELASPLNPVDIAPAAEPQQPINGDADSGW
jgi:hypothetical protein